MKIFRIKALLATLVIIGLTSIFCIYYIDNLAKSAVISSLQAVTGAKVEIESSSLSLSPIGFSFSGIQIANKEKPMENTVEIKDLSAHVELAPVFRKRFVISEIVVAGIALDTPRKTSGALPKSPPPPPKKDPLIDWSKLDPDNYVKSLSLKSVTGIDTAVYTGQANRLKTRFNQTSESFNVALSTAKNTPLLSDLETAYSKYDALTQAHTLSPNDLVTLREGIDSLKSFRDKITLQKELLEKSHTDYQATMAEINRAKDTLPKLVDQDLDRALKALDLSQYNAKGISEMLFKDSVLAQIEQAKRVFDIVGQLNGSNDEKIKRVRSEGTTIEFPLKKEYPKLWIQRVTVSETHFTGEMRHFSTSQQLTGHPMTVDLLFPINHVPIQVSFIADYRSQTHPFEQIRFRSRAVELTPEQVKNMSKGLLTNCKGSFMTSGSFSRIRGQFFGSIEGKLEPAPIGEPSKNWLTRSLASMPDIRIGAHFDQKEDGFVFALRTNIDEHLAKEFKALQKEVLDKARTQLREKLSVEIAKQQAELTKALTPIQADIDAYKQQLTALSQADAKINALSEQLTKRLEAQNAILKQKAEAQVDAVQNKVKAEAASQLKSRLKF